MVRLMKTSTSMISMMQITPQRAHLARDSVRRRRRVRGAGCEPEWFD
jgi:hypothetical protein